MQSNSDSKMDGGSLPTEIPALYATEDVETNEKIIYQKWVIPQVGFRWLIAELDPKENIAFGWANLNDDLFAEWGYISIDELKENNAYPVKDWKPVKFSEAKNL